ncbi:flagellar biosynthesis anti-sigma factor FlgM [Halotalea alkalilenta]|uniref:Negative regulator of flagellin synthesis n=1 Tax=Halotalea alkalilenta TaxID=376489 RepID=A0A172YGI7_9GAMM|nr:flagellar biosynthesis anti-sigma factor FlgM [Halotalea alkalilenta]ANF58378.1 hypothetical protein A5892_13600 [Halotalea alkalilenta]
MKIDPRQGLRPSTAPTEIGVHRPPTSASDAERAEGVTALHHAGTVQDTTQDVDVQRVNELRQLISEGQFEIDTDRIADGLITDVRSFVQE